jgi:hypothetical protein
MTVKKSQMDVEMNSPSTMFGREPSLGTLEHAIMVDQRLSALEKRRVLEGMLRDMGHPSASAPLTPSLLQRLGGGLLGAVLMRMLGAGAMGAGLGLMAGLIIDHYLSRPDPARKSLISYRIM